MSSRSVKPTPEFQWTDLDRVRQESNVAVDDPHPDKSFTEAQYTERYGLSRHTAMHQLNRLVEQGRLKCGKKFTINRRGHRQIVRCFWVP
jgi:hypothetical protein